MIMFNINLLSIFLIGSVLPNPIGKLYLDLFFHYLFLSEDSPFVKLNRGLHWVMHGDRYLDMVW